MVVVFRTESSSMYEVNIDERKIRRLHGANPATNRLGHDGEWKEFLNISELEIGESVVITWSISNEQEEFRLKTTVTSPIIDFVESSGLS